MHLTWIELNKIIEWHGCRLSKEKMNLTVSFNNLLQPKFMTLRKSGSKKTRIERRWMQISDDNSNYKAISKKNFKLKKEDREDSAKKEGTSKIRALIKKIRIIIIWNILRYLIINRQLRNLILGIWLKRISCI